MSKRASMKKRMPVLSTRGHSVFWTSAHPLLPITLSPSQALATDRGMLLVAHGPAAVWQAFKALRCARTMLLQVRKSVRGQRCALSLGGRAASARAFKALRCARTILLQVRSSWIYEGGEGQVLAVVPEAVRRRGCECQGVQGTAM